jgi:hypothetical protein
MIDRYTKDRFEAALPRVGGQPFWQHVGIHDGEHCYVIPIRPNVLLYVRSTVRADGLAADTAKDSIRCWIAADDRGTGLGSKDQRWISRVKGWDARMIETLRKLWTLGHQLVPCPWCGGPTLALKCKNGPNAGKWFQKCGPCDKILKTLKENSE